MNRCTSRHIHDMCHTTDLTFDSDLLGRSDFHQLHWWGEGLSRCHRASQDELGVFPAGGSQGSLSSVKISEVRNLDRDLHLQYS
jgi:hypothetical protein